MWIFVSLALAEDPTSTIDAPGVPVEPVAGVPAAPPPGIPDAPAPGVPAEPAPVAPRSGDLTPPPPNPLTMKLAGFRDAPAELHFGKGPDVIHRFMVVDASGPLSVTTIAGRVGDTAVLARRKKEVTVASVIGGIGLGLATGMLITHSVETVNNDPVLEPLTAVTGVLGFVVGVGAFGSALQGNERPWQYWSPDTLQPKVDAANAALIQPTP